MEVNQNMDKVNELLEQFDFNELSEQDKMYILSIMSEIEYINMRDTLKDTENFFAQSVDLNPNDSLYEFLMNNSKNENRFIKFLKHPIQLYKVAASIVIVLGIYSFFHYSNPQGKNSLLALHDTIFINKIDTVYSKIVDTVKVIKEKIVYIPKERDLIASVKLLSNSKLEYDCNREICPNNVDKIKELAFNNNVSSDTLWKDFIVSVK
jgi:hypothetical protein